MVGSVVAERVADDPSSDKGGQNTWWKGVYGTSVAGRSNEEMLAGG